MDIYADALNRLDTSIVPIRDCQKVFNHIMRETTICAGGKLSRDTCVGDSGGPLLTPFRLENYLRTHPKLIGIVSYGSQQCGTAGYPGVYTKVVHFIEWILDNLK